MDHDVLKEQVAYYDARAKEYDRSLQEVGATEPSSPEHEQANQEWLQIVNAVHALGHVDEILELACGTGIWTQELLSIGGSITALDASPQMIDLNRAKTAMPAITYQCVDLFQWEPERQYDLVFFAFWLSHVPRSELSNFLAKVMRATKPGGRVFMIDEPEAESNISGPNLEGSYQQRTLEDGRSFRIVKVYYEPREIERELMEQGFQLDSQMIGRVFFCLNLSRAS